MGVYVNWDDEVEKRVLHLTFNAPWTWADFEAIDDDIERAFNSTSNIVTLLIDLRHAGEMPIEVIHRLRDAYADATYNLDRYIFIGVSEHFKTLITVADNYYTMLGGHLDFTFAETLDEARHLLKQGDANRA